MINEEQVRNIVNKVLKEQHLHNFIKIFEKEHNLFRGSHDKIGLPETIVIPQAIVTQIVEKFETQLTEGSIPFIDENGHFAEDKDNLSWDSSAKVLKVTGDTFLDGAVVINESGAAVDFRVESDVYENLFVCLGATNQVGFFGVPDEGIDWQMKKAQTTLVYRVSANERPWLHWHSMNTNDGFAMGTQQNDAAVKQWRFNYDNPIGSSSQNLITIDAKNTRIGIFNFSPSVNNAIDLTGAFIASSYIQATTAKLINLTNGYIPYHVSDAFGLANSPIYTDGTNTGFGTVAPDGIIHASHSALASTALFERSGQAADNNCAVARILATKTSDMGDGFGSSIMYCIRDNAAVINPIAIIGAVRDGADNSGAIVLQTYNAGSYAERVRIDKTGNLWIKGQQELRFYNNGNYVGFKAPTLEGNQIWALPLTDGNLNDVLITDGEGNLSWALGGGGNGATTFLGLIDTPVDYIGAENKIVKVNATPDALIFGANISDLEDVDPIAGKAGKYAKVKAGDAGIEWVAGTGEGATVFPDLTDTPTSYVGEAGKFCRVNAGEDGLEFAAGADGGVAGPVLIFDSGFDDLALGNINGKGSYSLWGSWVNGSGADCTAEIVVDPEGGKMLRLDDQSGANSAKATLTMSPGLNAEVLMGIVEWKVKVSVLEANSRGYFRFMDKDIGATSQGGYFRGDSSDIWYRSSGNITARLVAAVVDTWYIVRTFFDRLGNYSVWWVDGAFEQSRIAMNAGDKFDFLELETRDIYSGNVFDIKYVKVWSLHYVQ